MHFKLIAPASGQHWVPSMVEGILTTPQNKDFNRENVVRRLEELHAQGHTYEEIDGEGLTADERATLYGEAYAAVVHAGNRYRIRQVFGSARHGGGDHLGTGIPALIVFRNEEPADVYPHELPDGTYRTIRDYIDSLDS
jgi:hypothetical protein